MLLRATEDEAAQIEAHCHLVAPPRHDVTSRSGFFKFTLRSSRRSQQRVDMWIQNVPEPPLTAGREAQWLGSKSTAAIEIISYYLQTHSAEPDTHTIANPRPLITSSPPHFSVLPHCFLPVGSSPEKRLLGSIKSLFTWGRQPNVN